MSTKMMRCTNCSYNNSRTRPPEIDLPEDRCEVCGSRLRPVEPYDPILIEMLVQASQNNFAQNVLAIAADRADDVYGNGDVSKCGRFLRWIAEQDTNRLLPRILFTGSRCYGSPNERSDVDWVFVVPNYRNAEFIADEFADTFCADYGQELPDIDSYEVSGLSDLAFRIGPINLICVSTMAQWATWVEATWYLAKAATKYGPRTDRDAIIQMTDRLLRNFHTTLGEAARYKVKCEPLTLNNCGI